jgi:tellurite resistance protein TehA-like permease
MLEKSFLATWCTLFAILFLFGSAGLSLWSLSLREEATNQAMTTILAAVCAVGGAAFGLLGRAFSQIDKLERRVKHLERKHRGGSSESREEAHRSEEGEERA